MMLGACKAAMQKHMRGRDYSELSENLLIMKPAQGVMQQPLRQGEEAA